MLSIGRILMSCTVLQQLESMTKIYLVNNFNVVK